MHPSLDEMRQKLPVITHIKKIKKTP